MSANISRHRGCRWRSMACSSLLQHLLQFPLLLPPPFCDWGVHRSLSANGNASGAKGTTSFVVPALVDKIKFEVVGGAGGYQLRRYGSRLRC